MPAATCPTTTAVAALATPGGQIELFEGEVRGEIGVSPRGAQGFGYDPIFEPAGERAGGRTFGQYRQAEKDAISHRGRAARRIVPVLRELGY